MGVIVIWMEGYNFKKIRKIATFDFVPKIDFLDLGPSIQMTITPMFF